jgi:hypothetical protein
MSGQKTISRTLIAAAGAILLSTVAVGSAVAPAAHFGPQLTKTLNA